MFLLSSITVGQLVCFHAKGQVLSGRVLDKEEGEPLAFVAVALSETGKGAISDVDGKFRLSLPANYQGKVVFQYVGYEPLTLTPEQVKAQPIIYLSPQVTELEGVVFRARENPALPIMRKVIRHKRKNDPLKYDQYRYRAYSKAIYRLDGESKSADSLVQLILKKSIAERSKQDSSILQVQKAVNSRYLFFTESVSEVKYIKPGVENEEILASDVAGLNSGLFASIGGQYQTFGFYKDVLRIARKDYISPLKNGALQLYDYYIEDTTFYKQDTVYVLSFEPKKHTNFSALEGLLYVDMKGYGLTHVKAHSVDQVANVSVKIHQRYERIDGKWFPIQLDTKVRFKDFQYHGRNLIVENKRYIQGVDLNTNYTTKDFSDVSINVQAKTMKEQVQILSKNRAIALDSMELNTFAALDTINSGLRILETVSEAALTQRIKVGPVDFKLNEILRLNRYERVRLGIGLCTNEEVSDIFSLGAYAGYGFGDKAWKYGAHLQWDIDKRTDTYTRLTYRSDLREAGTEVMFEGKIKGLHELIRNFQGNRYDHERLYKISLNRRIAPFIYGEVSYTHTRESPTYTYTYSGEGFDANNYLVSEMSLSLRYVRNEQYLNLYGKRVPIKHDFPSVNLKYSYGNSGWLRGDLNFYRVDLGVEYNMKSGLGKSHFLFRLGYTHGDLPYGRLLTGWGNKASLINAPEYFQTSTLYEFLSDRAMSLLMSHNFGNVLITSRISKPELVLYQNLGIGSLSAPKRYQDITFQTMEQGYFESGIGLRDLIRYNFFDLAYLGFGVDTFYRYGPYQLDGGFAKNLAIKLNMNLNF